MRSSRHQTLNALNYRVGRRIDEVSDLFLAGKVPLPKAYNVPVISRELPTCKGPYVPEEFDWSSVTEQAVQELLQVIDSIYLWTPAWVLVLLEEMPLRSAFSSGKYTPLMVIERIRWVRELPLKEMRLYVIEALVTYEFIAAKKKSLLQWLEVHKDKDNADTERADHSANG